MDTQRSAVVGTEGDSRSPEVITSVFFSDSHQSLFIFYALSKRLICLSPYSFTYLQHFALCALTHTRLTPPADSG